MAGINTFHHFNKDYQPIHIGKEANMLQNVTHKPHQHILEEKNDKFEKKKEGKEKFYDSWETLCFHTTTRGSCRERKEHASLLLPEKQHRSDRTPSLYRDLHCWQEVQSFTTVWEFMNINTKIPTMFIQVCFWISPLYRRHSKSLFTDFKMWRATSLTFQRGTQRSFFPVVLKQFKS